MWLLSLNRGWGFGALTRLRARHLHVVLPRLFKQLFVINSERKVSVLILVQKVVCDLV